MNALSSVLANAITPHHAGVGSRAGRGAARVVTRDESRSRGEADGKGLVAPPRSTVAQSTKAPRKKPQLRQDGQNMAGAIVDWVSITVRPQGAEAEWLRQDPDTYCAHLVASLFPKSNLFTSEHEARGRFGYTHTCKINAGRTSGGFVAFGGNNGTVSVTLSGVGCKAVHCWYLTAAGLQRREDAPRITRVDLAYDDYEAKHIKKWEWFEMACRHEIRAGNGPAIKKDPEVSGPFGPKMTWYVGQKGVKELCVYNKGVEQGDPESPWLRAEVRIWSKDRVIPFEVLTKPLSYIRGAYNILRDLPGDVCDKIKTVRKAVSAKVVAATSWLRHAAGPLINVLSLSLGKRRAAEVLLNDCRRSGVPRRFSDIPSWDQLSGEIGLALCRPSPTMAVPF